MKSMRRIISMILCISILLSAQCLNYSIGAEDIDDLELSDNFENDIEGLIISEIANERTEYSKTFLMDNGNKVYAEYTMPIHYQDDKDNWVDYDNSLVTDHKQIQIQNKVSATTDQVAKFDDSTFKEIEVFTNKNSNINISFARNTSDNSLVFVGEGEKAVSWGYRDINLSSGSIIEDKTEYEGNEKFTILKNITSTLKYESVYTNVDMELITSPVGIKENLILNSKESTNRFVSEYQIGKLIPRQLDERVIALFNENNEVEYYINAEYMYDSNGEVSYDLKLNILEINNGTLTVELIANSDWLTDTERSYPVTIDPSFITGQQWSSVECTYITDNHPNTAYGYGSSTGYTGTIYAGILYNKKYRSLLKMVNLPSLNNGDMVIDATVNLYLYNGYANSTGFYTDNYVGVYAVKDSWSQTSVTWNSRPNFYSPLLDYVKFDETSQPGWCTMNITKAMKDWCEGTRPNYGIMLKNVDESNCDQCAAFFSSNYPSSATPRPAFQITYRNNKGIEDYWTTTSVGVGGAGTLYVNDYSGALTFITPIASTASPAMSAALGLVYNSYMAIDKYTKTKPYTGVGWKMSIQQTLLPSTSYGLTGDSAEQYPFVYTDSDGTEHYFYKKTENGSYKLVDEDGLDLELTESNDDNQKFTITDKDKNKLIFNSNGVLRFIKDAYNNTITNYYTDSKINYIRDASDKPIILNRSVDEDYLVNVVDSAGRQVNIDYTVQPVNSVNYTFISRITRADGTYADFTYDNSGLLTSVIDNGVYKIDITYKNNSSKKVTSIQEYGKNSADETNWTVGNKITFDRTKYNTTVTHSSGNDGLFNDGNNNTDSYDDIITTYQFDNCGRTKSVQAKTLGTEDLGAANYEYTNGTPNSSGSNIYKINRITSQHVLGANTYNYLKNHSFEASTGWTNREWSGSNNFTGTYATEDALYGQKSYKIKVISYSGLSSGRAYQDIYGLESGGTYTLSGYIKVTEFSGNSDISGAVLDATSFNSDDTTPNYYSERISEVTDTAVNNGWRRVSVTFIVPDNSVRIRANVALKAATGTVYFDGIQLEKAETAGSYNMLENSSFENSNDGTQPTSWSRAVGLSFSTSGDGVSSDTNVHGSKSLKVIGNVAESRYITQTIPVSGTENDTYIVSGWAKANSVALDSANVRKFKISIGIHYSDGTVKFKNSADFNPTVSDWQFVSKAFDLSDGTSANKTPTSIEIYLHYSKEGNTAYFDNISLVKEPAQSYTYDSKGNLISVVANAQQNSSMEYNADNKLTKVLDPKGYSYKYTYNNHGSVEKVTTQNEAEYTYTYDNKGNVLSAVGAGTDGLQVHAAQNVIYPGIYSSTYIIKTYDQRNKKAEYTYDADHGTLQNYKDPKNVVTSYSYNLNNNLIEQVSKGGSTVEYSYDEDNYNLELVETNTAVYSFGYNCFGERTRTQVGNRILATYTCNNDGQLTQMNYGNNNTVNYEYDKYGNIREKKVNGVKSYEGIADNTGTITKAIDHINDLQYNYVYDSTDRLISSTITDTSNNQRRAMFEYGFDLNNNLSKLSTLTPTGTNKMLYSYGEDNRLTDVTLDNQKAVSYTYNGLGRLTNRSINLTTPLTNTYTYGTVTINNTEYQHNLIDSETIGNTVYRYEYDANGNITAIKDANNALIESYTYDDLNELTAVNYYQRNQRYEYTYDTSGNIVQEKIYENDVLTATNNYSYTDQTWCDLLKRYNGSNITYDTIGNPLSYRDGITFTWSNGRQLQSYTKNNETINYTYDGSGMRLSKTDGGTTHKYLYNSGLLMQETIGEKILDYSYTPSGQVISVRYKANSNATPVYYYYALNSRGDVVGLYDASGALYAQYTYDAWGNPVSVTDGSGTVIESATDIANLQSLRYRSYYFDSDTGFYYLQSRYYDPVTHRFINADGLVSTGTGVLGFNMFAYCINNPVNYCDNNGFGSVYIVGFIGPLRPDDALITADKIFVSGCFETYANYMFNRAINKQNGNNNSTSNSSSNYTPKPLSAVLDGTISIGGSFSAGCGIGLNFSNGCGINSMGDVMRITTISLGGSSPSVSAGAYYSTSKAKTVKELEGISFVMGGSAGEAVSIGYDYGIGLNNISQNTVNLGATIKAPIPFEGHAYFSYTFVTKLYNIYDPASMIKYVNNPFLW